MKVIKRMMMMMIIIIIIINIEEANIRPYCNKLTSQSRPSLTLGGLRNF